MVRGLPLKHVEKSDDGLVEIFSLHIHLYKVGTCISLLRLHDNIAELDVTGMADEKATSGQVAPHC